MENTIKSVRLPVERILQTLAVWLLFASLGFLFFARPEMFADPRRVSAMMEYPIPGGGGGWVQTCFPAGTLVNTSEGEVPIETLKINNEVVGVDPASHKTRTQRVTSLHKNVKSQLYDLSFASGRTVAVSHGHPFAVWDEAKKDFLFVPVEKLWLGAKSVVLEKNGSLGSDEIVSVRKKDAPTTVYNLSVWPDKTYVAGGVLVHNKDPQPRGSRWNGKGWGCLGGGSAGLASLAA